MPYRWLFIILLFTTSVLVGACSNHTVYNTLQNNAQEKCRELFGRAYEQCIEENSQSFPEYEKEKQEALEKKSS